MRRPTGAVLAAVTLTLTAACGGGGDGPGRNRAEWEERNGALVRAYSRSLDDAINNINQGARANTVGSCTQVVDDARELDGEAFPVPNAAADAALRRAVDNGTKAAASCLSGAQAGGAHDIERAQDEFVEARKAMDEAEATLRSWP